MLAKVTLDSSDVILDSAKTRHRDVLVLSERVNKAYRIYRGVFAGRIDTQRLPAEGTEFYTKDGKLVKQPYVVPEKLFLPPVLVQLKLSDHAYQAGSSDIAVPLTPKFFEYFTFSELEQRKMLEVRKSNAGWTVSLQVPLRGRQPVLLTREYGEKEIIKLQGGTPAFAVWPDFYADDWKENFAAYIVLGMGDEVHVRPLLGSGEAEEEEAKSDPQRRNLWIWPCSAPPIGFSIRLRNGLELVNAGLVLRDRLNPPPPVIGRHWEIGVDFGTSSTTVMVRRDNSEPAAMPFTNRTLALTEAGDQITDISNNLYPVVGSALAVDPPFCTLLYEVGLGYEADRRRDMPTATVIGVPPPAYTARYALELGNYAANTPVRDVKWGRQKRRVGPSPLMSYLEMLVRYVVCEARSQGVAHLTMHWSYPLSLPAGAQTTMQSFWEGVESRYSRGDMQIKVQPGVSESEAVCRCLASVLHIRASNLTIAVDVGGGSTDVAFWSEERLLDQFSFKVAGNDVLDPKCLDEESLKELYLTCIGPPLPLEFKPGDIRKSSPEIWVNGALLQARTQDKEIFRDSNPRLHPVPTRILETDRQGTKPWGTFRSLSYLFFGGLCYYLGLHTRLMEVSQETPIDVYIAGRGASLLTWIGPVTKVEEFLMRAFGEGLGKRGSGDDSKFFKFKTADAKPNFKGNPMRYDIRNPELKTEVAKGLLLPPLNVRQMPKDGILIGEVEWTRKGEPQKWYQRLSAKEMAELEPPKNFDSTTIGHFIEIAKDPLTIERLNLDPHNLKALYVEGSNVQDLIRTLADGEDFVSQPIFAYELKVLMQKYAELATNPPAKKQSA